MEKITITPNDQLTQTYVYYLIIEKITTTLGYHHIKTVFKQKKPRKPLMFTTNSSKNAQGY